MARSTSEQIDDLDEQIAKAERAESRSIEGRALKQNLPAMYARMELLLARQERETNGGIATVIQMDRPS